MTPFEPERRRAARRALDSLVMIVAEAPEPIQILGILVDESELGFRMTHEHAALPENQTVRFLHRAAEGKARVVWNRAVSGRTETGLEYL